MSTPQTTDAIPTKESKDQKDTQLAPLYAMSEKQVRAAEIAETRVYRQYVDDNGETQRAIIRPKDLAKMKLRIDPYKTTVNDVVDALKPGTYYLQAVNRTGHLIGATLVTIEPSEDDDREEKPEERRAGLFETPQPAAATTAFAAPDPRDERLERLEAMVEKALSQQQAPAAPNPLAPLELMIGMVGALERLRPQPQHEPPRSASPSEREQYLEERLRATQQESDRLRADIDAKRIENASTLAQIESRYRKDNETAEERFRERIKAMEKEFEGTKKELDGKIAQQQNTIDKLKDEMLELKDQKMRAEAEAENADRVRSKVAHNEKSGIGRFAEEMGSVVQAAQPIFEPILDKMMKGAPGGVAGG